MATLSGFSALTVRNGTGTRPFRREVEYGTRLTAVAGHLPAISELILPPLIHTDALAREHTWVVRVYPRIREIRRGEGDRHRPAVLGHLDRAVVHGREVDPGIHISLGKEGDSLSPDHRWRRRLRRAP